MLGFLRKSKVLLTVELGGRQIAEITDRRLPEEILPSVPLREERSVLQLSDSAGTRFRYDMSSAVSEGATFAHFSVRVNENHTVGADCLLSTSATVPTEEFRLGLANAIRFQPFFLPESANPVELVGRGLFQRGLHFPGTITPGNVSLLCICDSCRHSFRLQSFHAGFANLVYFYCEDGVHTLVASSYLDNAPPLLAEADVDATLEFEKQLPPCAQCGTSFRYYNPLKCPACRAPYIDFARFPSERATEYYGNHHWGMEPQHLTDRS